ncbi:MAG: phosphodiester glycosidase family protein [Solobacterium sp.]|nr:phosphodiester glycosidase family protein [Solobacterium sp.]
MIDSEIRTYTYSNGEFQRVQIVRAENWNSLQFITPAITKEAFQVMCDVYRDQMIRVAPMIFGELVLFHIPDDMELPFSVPGISDNHTAARIRLMRKYDAPDSQLFLKLLEERGFLRIEKGKLPVRRIISYTNAGFLSDCCPEAALKVNASFFTFDVPDGDSPYDVFGTPVGLMVKDGKILNPPLYDREALIVDRHGNVSVRQINLRNISCSIKGTIYERPFRRRTPFAAGNDVVIIGNKVIAVRPGGNTVIPTSGFVIHTDRTDIRPGDRVEYKGLEDVIFAIQAGNSVMVNGRMTDRFISRFYNIYHLESVVFPPCLYPLDFEKSRAPRIMLGTDCSGKPVFVWAEGAGKTGYEPGKESCGASLKELGMIAKDIGLYNAVNLDGGGSAQILLNNRRELMVSGRDPVTGSDKERPVANGIMII